MALPTQADQFLSSKLTGIEDAEIGGPGGYRLDVIFARPMAPFASNRRDDGAKVGAVGCRIHIGRMAAEALRSLIGRYQPADGLFQRSGPARVMSRREVKAILPLIETQAMFKELPVLKL